MKDHEARRGFLEERYLSYDENKQDALFIWSWHGACNESTWPRTADLLNTPSLKV